MPASVRDQLVETLEEILRLQKKLVSDARNHRVSASELVAQVIMLERLDDRRDDLLDDLRHDASAAMRTYRRSPPIRQLVLEALADFRWPQDLKFVQEYLFVSRELQIESRALAPLRRDEQRSWERAPEARDAFVAPALYADGTANTGWLTSSAWELERRIVDSEETERLIHLQKILTLAGRRGTGSDAVRPWKATDVILDDYAKKILGIEPLSVSASNADRRAWRLHVRDEADKLIGEIRSEDDPARREIAQRLLSLPEHQQIWGRPKS